MYGICIVHLPKRHILNRRIFFETIASIIRRSPAGNQHFAANKREQIQSRAKNPNKELSENG